MADAREAGARERVVNALGMKLAFSREPYGPSLGELADAVLAVLAASGDGETERLVRNLIATTHIRPDGPQVWPGALHPSPKAALLAHVAAMREQADAAKALSRRLGEQVSAVLRRAEAAEEKAYREGLAAGEEKLKAVRLEAEVARLTEALRRARDQQRRHDIGLLQSATDTWLNDWGATAEWLKKQPITRECDPDECTP